MFENLNLNKIPNNLCKTFVVDCNDLPQCRHKFPYEEYNDVGEFIGYSWYYGDTVTLEFNLEGELTLESDALIFTAKGSAPTESTQGIINQKAYNTTDFISWTCTAADDVLKKYVWEQDAEWQAPSSGTDVYVTVADYLIGKYLTVDIYNFRYEKEFTSDPLPAQEVFDFNITNNMVKNIMCGDSTNIETEVQYKPLSRGVHYLTLTLTDENNEYIETLIGQQSCPLIIK